MEIMCAKDTSELSALLSTKRHDSSLLAFSNWQITNDKQFIDAITTAPLRHAPARISCEDVAFLNTCIALQPDPNMDSNREPCMLDIKVTNCQKIARIAIVSEGNVLEIFKEFGEYETTIFTEFIDEYDENTVFLGEATIQPPATEVSIKFTRTKSKGPSMWIYGIRLFLTDSMREAKSSAFNDDIIYTLLSNASKTSSKENKRAEIAIKVLEESYSHNKEITNNKQFSAAFEKYLKIPALNSQDFEFSQEYLKTFGLGSNNLECNTEIERRNDEKDYLNYGDDHEKTNSFECKNRNITSDSGKEYSNCGDFKKSDIDIGTCIDKTETIKEAESGAFNYKDFILTFLSNVSNNGQNGETKMAMKIPGKYHYDKEEINENNEFSQEYLKTHGLCSNYLECKKEIGRIDNEKENPNCDDHEKTNSLECRNRNVRRDGEKDHRNCGENYRKFEIDIKTYIDNKFHDMEKRLMEKIDKMQAITNHKLDTILEKFEAQLNL